MSGQKAFFVGSLTETLPLLTMPPRAKHKIEQIYLWNPITIGLIM